LKRKKQPAKSEKYRKTRPTNSARGRTISCNPNERKNETIRRHILLLVIANKEPKKDKQEL
jgi:hypothetical protein